MPVPKVCILDYGSGNVRSVFNLFSSVTHEVKISNDEQDILAASHLVLPGVGAFATAMQRIQDNLPIKLIKSLVIDHKKPFLGICVGMQVLATRGFEFGESSGLNFIPGEVTALQAPGYPLPHVGWNDLQAKGDDPLLDGINDKSDFYFVHKYVFCPQDHSVIVATTNYGNDFCSIIRKENIVGVQFHPEKSQQKGKKLAMNFLGIV
jgi:imidazole glycerol-phosphate synthase subunit HisH